MPYCSTSGLTFKEVFYWWSLERIKKGSNVALERCHKTTLKTTGLYAAQGLVRSPVPIPSLFSPFPLENILSCRPLDCIVRGSGSSRRRMLIMARVISGISFSEMWNGDDGRQEMLWRSSFNSWLSAIRRVKKVPDFLLRYRSWIVFQ